MKNFVRVSLMAAALLLPTSVAQALDITPADADWSGDVNNTPGAIAEANALCGNCLTTEQYKAEVGGGESGPLSGSYQTTFLNTALDPSGATIVYTGGNIVANAYLFVKDGNQSPAWYLFDLSGWNGTETLNLSGFWPNQGAISHLSLFGSSQVPEPATLSLLGMGLLGFAAAQRRRLANRR